MIVTVTPNPALDRTLTVRRIAFGEATRAIASRLDWGGKGVNVSRALQALGAESVVMGFVGGAAGEALARGLADLGLVADLTPIAGETRTNVVVAEMDGERYVKVNEAGPLVSGEEVAAFFDQVRGRARAGDAWALCGSLPPGAPADFYARLIGMLRVAGARAFLDASGEPLRLGCVAAPFLVKPNRVEAEEMTGQSIRSIQDALRATRFFLRQGVALTALSLGAEGLLLASQERAVWAMPPSVRARSPVGAGDALLAGLVWAFDRGLELEEAARWGVAAGTAAALCEGVGVGARAEVEALCAWVEVTAIAY